MRLMCSCGFGEERMDGRERDDCGGRMGGEKKLWRVGRGGGGMEKGGMRSVMVVRYYC